MSLRYHTPRPTPKVCEARRRHIHGPIQTDEPRSPRGYGMALAVGLFLLAWVIVGVVL